MRNTLKSPGDIDKLFSLGKRIADPNLVLLYRRTPEERGLDGRVVFVAGKKTGGAVFRNRAKRVLRAAVGRRGGVWPGYDVALIARKGTPSTNPSQLDAALRRLSQRIAGRST